MGQKLIKLMNGLTRLRRSSCRPAELLILLPSCLQSSQCAAKVTNDVQECRRCGRCKVSDVLELCDRYGVRAAVATGGRLALKLTRDKKVKGIVAIACEPELTEGQKAAFPKPTLGVINLRPNGPCTDTDVDIDEVEEAIRFFLRD